MRVKNNLIKTVKQPSRELSNNIAFILNPHAWYACITCSIDVTSVLFFMSFTSSAVPKCILRDVIITNGIC